MTDAKRDKYLRERYGYTLAAYNEELKRQHGGCGICTKSAFEFKKPLHVDHDHKALYLKLDTTRIPGGGWYGQVLYRDAIFSESARTRNEVVRSIRQKLKTASIRGLLCWRCNAALRSLGDSPVLFAAAADYLRRPRIGQSYQETMPRL